MARRASVRKPPGKPVSAQARDPKDRLIDAALSLAARQGWRRTGLAEIAAEAGLRLREAHRACASRIEILAAFHRRIDQVALAGVAAASDESPRDRLFDVLMRRFDALQPHRPALRAILRDSVADPAALLGAPALLCSMGWMLEAAGVSTAGWRGRLRVHILAALYLSVLRDFFADDSADLTKTMAALDRRLRRAEAWLGLAEKTRAESIGEAG